MGDPVQLYIGKSVQELNARAEENVNSIKSAKLGLNSMTKTFQAAEKAALDRDEERAYILFMRTLFVYDRIRKMPDFRKSEFTMMKDMKKATDEAERLAAKLKIRYQRVEAEELAKRLDAASDAAPSAAKTHSATENKPADSAASVIDSATLYKLLKSSDTSPNVLVFDLRSPSEFEACRLRHDCLINIDGALLKPGCSVSGVEALISAEWQTLWKARRVMTHIITMDWNSDDKSLSPQHPIQVFKDAIYKWDSAGALKCEPRLLQRGLQGVLLAYPTITTDPAYRGPDSGSENGNGGGGGGLSSIIAYPSLEDESRRRLEEQRKARIAAAAAAAAKAEAEAKAKAEESKKLEEEQQAKQKVAEASAAKAKEQEKLDSKPVDSSASVNGPRSSAPTVDRSLKPQPAVPASAPAAAAAAPASTSGEVASDGSGESKTSSGSGGGGNSSRPQVDRSIKPLKLSAKSAEAPASLTASSAAAASVSSPPLGNPTVKPGIRLPSGWHVGNENGRYFYVDTNTGKFYWDLPDEVLESLEKPPPKPPRSPVEPPDAANAAPSPAPVPPRSEKPAPPAPTAAARPPGARQATNEVGSAAATRAAASETGGGLKRVASQPNLAKLRSKPDSADAAAPGSEPASANQQPQEHRQQPQAAPTPGTSVAAARPFSAFDAHTLSRMAAEYGSVPHGLTGLRNLGNTCYLNSTVQCLSNTPVLASYFLQGTFRDHVNQSNPLGHQGDVAEQFSIVVQALWAGRYACVSPYDFKSTIGRHAEAFAGSEQQDSQEFLLFLLDGLHEDLNRARRRKPTLELEDKEGLPDAERATRAWQRHCLINESIMVELFQGQFKSTLLCEHCRYKSVTFDAFMYLSLPVVSDSSCCLSDCLQAFLKPERLSGSSRWFCPRCRRDQSAVKKIDIWRLPPYLLIHLKRFSCDRISSRGRKLNTLVDFPITNLDLTDYHSSSNKSASPLTYNLYAVSNHYGSMESGHYTAFCRNANLKRWYKFDDETVTEMRTGEIRSVSNYILFYSRLRDSFQVSSL